MDIIIRESFSHQHKGDFLYMSEIHQPDEGTKEALPSPDAPSKENVSVDHILSHLFQKSDLLYKFVMIYKDYIFQPRDYGTGELVTSMEAHVTSYIDEHPGAAPSELAAYWSRTNGFISQILKKLEEKGLSSAPVPHKTPSASCCTPPKKAKPSATRTSVLTHSMSASRCSACCRAARWRKWTRFTRSWTPTATCS